MYFQHVYDKSLAQASYFIGCQKAGVAAVIDPKHDIDTYIDIAKQNNMSITHIFETHIHADFLSGSRELAAITGATMYLSAEGGEGWEYEFKHHGVKDKEVIKLGNLLFEVLHTPGHTPESISLLLTDTPASMEPVMLFTGDFVFVGDVGRPDLLEKAAGVAGTANSGALMMYQSIQKFKALSDFIQVWPGHGAGSACGKALGAVPSTTVGYEKARNWAFQHEQDEQGFINYLLSDQPEPPSYFAKMKVLNKSARPLLTAVPKLKELNAEELISAQKQGITLIDARPKQQVAEGYIPGSIHIEGNNSFATWAGWFLTYHEPFILLAAESQLDDLTRKLMRIGLDNIAGYIPSTETWTANGRQLNKAKVINLAELKSLIHSGNTEIIDVRNTTEYKSGHIEQAKHVFVGTLLNHLHQIPKDKKIVIHCQSGARSAIAYSLLAKHGYNQVFNYSAGMNEWVKENLPLVS